MIRRSRFEYRARLWLLITCFAFSTMIANAQDTVDAAAVEATLNKMRQFMELEREKLIEDELSLSETEANAFWPVYREYRADYGAWQDQLTDMTIELVERLESLTEEQARTVMSDYLEIQRGMLDVRERYISRFESVISARKLVRLFQIENKIDTFSQATVIYDVPLLRAGND